MSETKDWDVFDAFEEKVAELDRLRAELAKVTADHKAMVEYALKLDASNDDYQAELATKDARIAAQAGELSDLHKKYDDCRETLLEVSNALKVSEASTAGNRSELNFDKKHVARCKDRIAAGALEDDLTEHHRMRTIEDLRKEFLEIESLRKELAEAYRLRDFHHNDAINSRLELEAANASLAETKAALAPLDDVVHALGIEDREDITPAEAVRQLQAALEVYDRTFPKKSELELHAALEAADARIAELEQLIYSAQNELGRLSDSRALLSASLDEECARAERAEAEADSLRATIDNMRAMNIKLTFEATGKVLAAEAECRAMREALQKATAAMERASVLLEIESRNREINLAIAEARAALNPSPAGPNGDTPRQCPSE